MNSSDRHWQVLFALHTPEQQSVFRLHPTPDAWQHFPLVQLLPRQQSLLFVQAAPSGVQSHIRFVQLPEQQSVFELQALSLPMQQVWAGEHSLPGVRLSQQSASAVQGPPTG